MNNRISVIMSTYKEPVEFVSLAIESILNQTNPNFEFIIILDNPENHELNSCVYRYAELDGRIRVLPNEKNMGLSSSLNRGIKIAKGEFIARMDADDIALPHRLEMQLRYLLEKEYDLVGSNIAFISHSGSELKRESSNPTNHLGIEKRLMISDCVAHPTWLGKREVFIKNQGYQLLPGAEDYDFLVRAVLNNYKIGNVRQICLKYRLSSGGLSRNNKHIQNMVANFVRNKYIKGAIPTYNEWVEYSQSIEGRSYYEEAREYYKIAEELKEMLRCQRWISFGLHGIKLLIINNVAKKVAYQELKEQIFKRVYKKYY